MSTHSAKPSINGRRHNSNPSNGRPSRALSYSRRKHMVPESDAYSFALRAALLSHLLQPRAKRLQHVAPANKPVHRSSTSVTDLVRDFSVIREPKSTKFPHNFPVELDKRITGILIGKERMPEYNDPVVKRTFAAFLNQFKEPTFRKSVEKDRKVEDLLLVFFSRATSELQKGKLPNEDAWKLMVDRHVALFVRLISAVLKANDWTRDRPELASRLQDLEGKLLTHAQDLTHTRNGSAGQTIEVDVPISFDVKDIPGAMKVGNIFGRSYDEIQADVTANKDFWTPEAAMNDLKLYQMHMNLKTRSTLSSDAFDLQEAYELWRKNEVHDLTQMVLAILQAYPELARHSSVSTLTSMKTTTAPGTDSGYSDGGYPQNGPESSYLVDQPADLAYLTLDDSSPRDSMADDAAFTFIPPEPRSYYAAVLRRALANDIKDKDLQPAQDDTPVKLLSKESIEVLSEIALRWRIPHSSRVILFLDVIRDKFHDREIDMETLDQAFMFVKEPQPEIKQPGKLSQPAHEVIWDRSKWTLVDHGLHQDILSSLHDTLLRELFELLQHCFEPKPPSVGLVMHILEHHIYDDPLFARTPEDLDGFTHALEEALREKARDAYTEMLSNTVPEEAHKWEFHHVIELGKAVVNLSNKIQKRYRKNPHVMGVSPLQVLVGQIFPAFAADARDLVRRVMEIAKSNEQEVPIDDGFKLYSELVQIRQVHAQALPDVPFGFKIEDLLSEFVWRFIALTDQNWNKWIEGAVEQDDFAPRSTEDDIDTQRHSSSALDMFRIFNQAIDEIVNLGWDDDLQYAKFMTAISKSVGSAVQKYCEMLETRFMKELEQPGPDQESAARQTTQERWMQLAKETLAAREKSLVKLNNIEYTTVHLDKVEKEMNVDGIAKTVQQHAPPVPKTRQTSKFVFTIKIIEAEDLRACDMNGLSDPYVVLGDEYQKRLAKTRIIHGNLNPRWDETVDIITSGPLNVIATIWDWDALGDHDCVGRTTLKLDPSHFSDFMPREFWLDLDTQGRLLLRVSMEGERDDIQFYFGRTFRQLKRTERDMTRKITDKLLAYIQSILSRKTLQKVLGQGISVSSVRALAGGYLSRAQGRPTSGLPPPKQMDPAMALKPLFDYFDENFAIMKQTLTDPSMLMVMTRLWKEVLVTIEALLVPPLSDKPSSQRPLTPQEVDVVYRWLKLMFDFFHAEGDGVAMEVLRSPKYHDLQYLNFFYFETTQNLIKTSDGMAAQAMSKQKSKTDYSSNRMSAPPGSFAFSGAPMGMPSTRRTKSIMLSRNLGTMKKAKEDKRKEAQAEPNDDMILRILRMRPEAERYLKDRSRQKERLAAHAAAEAIVRQSILAQRQDLRGRVGQLRNG